MLHEVVLSLKRYMKTFIVMLTVMLIPSMVQAADTELDKYQEAPYKDVAKVYTIDNKDGSAPKNYVEIPEKYIFSPDELERIVTVKGHEWKDLVIVSRYGDDSYIVFDMFEEKNSRIDLLYQNLNADWDSQVPIETREKSINDAYKAALYSTIDDFLGKYWEYPFGRGGGGPIEPIVSINGQPWQETEWKDYIVSHIREGLYPSDPLVSNPQYWEVFMNPANNGQAKEIIKTMENVTIPPSPGLTTALVNQVTLTLGQKEVIVYREGNAEVHTLDVAPEAPEGITMIPLRGVLDYLGAKLDYDGPSRKVKVQDGDYLVTLTIGDSKAFINDSEVPLTRPAEIKNERTLIPLRFVAENLHYKVSWDPDKQQILISK